MTYPYHYAAGAEVSGAVMSAIFNHYRRDEVIASLKKYHLDYLDPDHWYPVDQFIELLAEWATLPALTSNYVSVGMAMIYHIELDDDLDRLSGIEKLSRLGEFFMSQQRGPDIGKFVAKPGHNLITYTETTLWPDDIMYGYIYGAAQRYLPHQTHFTVRYASNSQRQEMGSEFTVLELKWE